MTSDHEIVWTFDAPGVVRAKARCNAAPDAPCRNMPECNCEEWDHEERDDEGYFHTIEQYGIDAEADADEVIAHRHTRLVDCNTCTWLNESDILECTGSFELEVGITPIRPIWVGPGYDWEPAHE